MQAQVVDKLCKAMIELLREKPIDKISIKELSIKAGVNRTSYNYHFKKITDIIDTILEDFGDGLYNELVSNYPGDDNYDHFYTKKVTIKYIYSNRDVMMTLITSGFDVNIMKVIRLTLYKFLKGIKFTGIDENGKTVVLNQGPVLELFIWEHVYNIMSYSRLWADSGYSVSDDALISYIEQVNQFRIDIARKNNDDQKSLW